MSETPTLDKFNLHPFGGRCTCFSDKYSECTTCTAIENQQARWKSLSIEDAIAARRELRIYETSNQDGR